MKKVKKSKKRFDKWKKNLIMTNVRLVRPLTFYIFTKYQYEKNYNGGQN